MRRVLCGLLFLMVLCIASVAPLVGCGTPDTKKRLAELFSPKQLAMMDHEMDFTVIPYSLAAPADCAGGMADLFPCSQVDLLAVVQPSALGSTNGNDLWGWTDSKTGKEYALIGLKNGTAFLDLSDPGNPVYVGKLASHGGLNNDSSWRDVKVYQDYAYIVQDYPDQPHGMQIFDLKELRNPTILPATFAETNHYSGFTRSHNLVINEDSGFLYAVGTENTVCSGGLSMFDLADPENPSFSGCFSSDGYTHDAQCVNYRGPDTDYQGDEICFASNEDTITVVNVTDKNNPVMISRTGYANHGYSHQGWLTEDQRYFVHDDESDEISFGHNTKTRTFDFVDLDAPVAAPDYLGQLAAIDHNQYVQGNHTYQANYKSGLRILRLDDPATGSMTEVAYFDTYPESDTASFAGAWSVYPFFESGIVLISDINRGLFVVRPDLSVPPPLFVDGFESGDTTAW